MCRSHFWNVKTCHIQYIKQHNRHNLSHVQELFSNFENLVKISINAKYYVKNWWPRRDCMGAVLLVGKIHFDAQKGSSVERRMRYLFFLISWTQSYGHEIWRLLFFYSTRTYKSLLLSQDTTMLSLNPSWLDSLKRWNAECHIIFAYINRLFAKSDLPECGTGFFVLWGNVRGENT